jgi:hypothetical protein
VEVASLVRRLVLGGALGAAISTCSGVTRAQEASRFDGRDRYTQFDRHLQTRQLRQLLEQPGQQYYGETMVLAGRFPLSTIRASSCAFRGRFGTIRI